MSERRRDREIYRDEGKKLRVHELEKRKTKKEKTLKCSLLKVCLSSVIIWEGKGKLIRKLDGWVGWAELTW